MSRGLHAFVVDDLVGELFAVCGNRAVITGIFHVIAEGVADRAARSLRTAGPIEVFSFFVVDRARSPIR